MILLFSNEDNLLRKLRNIKLVASNEITILNRNRELRSLFLIIWEYFPHVVGIKYLVLDIF